MSSYHYIQQVGGEEVWKPIPVSHRHHIEQESQPMFVTILSVSKLVEDLPHEEKIKLAYEGPLYFDWDSQDELLVIEKVQQFLGKLEALKLDLTMCRLYATGGRGYHLEIPQEVFIAKIPKGGIVNLPAIYREIALDLCVDTLDLRVYSHGRGRMWRQANVKRDNGRYKVPITLGEMREMTPELCHRLTSAPRQTVRRTEAKLCIDLAILYDRCAQKIDELNKKRAKIKPDPKAREKAFCESIQWMMAGIGIKAGVGFQELSTQLAICANTAGIGEDEFIKECEGIIHNHSGDGNRYNSPAKREEELRRMHRYMDGNFCYEFSVGAVKSLLMHSAPDLDGIQATKEDIREVIKEAEAEENLDQDEYADVAKGVTMTKYGVYVDTEHGKKRVCSVSFTNSCVLKSAETGQIAGYETDILVNGKPAGRQTLELDIFSGLVPFNRLAARYGHAFQGTDIQVRTLMMRFVENAKKKGSVQYIIKREGLDMVSIPSHEIPLLRDPFPVWADAHGVIMPEHIAATGLELTFAGYPDPRGIYKTDIRDAPVLGTWLKVAGNRDLLRDTLKNLMTCQKPEMLGKLIGWYVSCFWRQLFHKAYGKFPLLHVNGSAGAGKTEQNLALGSFFVYKQDVRALTPATTNFAIQQNVSASASLPLIIDEYKPHEMHRDVHNKLKLMFRDAYNMRQVERGGGTRESEDYRMLHQTQLSAPVVFISEAAEDEAAVMERVVLVTIVRPTANISLKWLARFQAYRKNRHLLGILGQYLAMSIVHEQTPETLMQEFDALYAVAQEEFMVTEADLAGGITDEKLREKQNAKERSVYNHTVAKFGMQQFRKLVNMSLGSDELDELMGELEDGIYSRMKDLSAATTPEYIKVLDTFSDISYHGSSDEQGLRKNKEYAYVEVGGRTLLELAVRPAYMRYRGYCRQAGVQALFGSPDAFCHALKDSPAFVAEGIGSQIQAPGVFTFSAAELARLGVKKFL